MATKREGLRPAKPKPSKPPAKSNAQRLKEYKERIKADPVLYEEWKRKKKDENERRRSSRTEEQIASDREKSRLRMQKMRERQKKEAPGPKKTPKKSGKGAQGDNGKRMTTREHAQKLEEKREANRQRQQKRRANMSAQKKRRINEKRRADYHEKKGSKSKSPEKEKKETMTFSKLIKGAFNSLKKSRNKLALHKLKFVRELLKRKKSTEGEKPCSFYRRQQPQNSFMIEHFFEKVAIDFPGQRGATKTKKVLTKTMVGLFGEFREQHPSIKTSFTTFKRRRPDHIVLASSRKFIQCLCEKCTNVMLLMNVINPYLPKGSESGTGRNEMRGESTERVRSVDDLVRRTICANSKRECWERECEHCGVSAFLDVLKAAVGSKGNEMKKWSRWEKTERSSKDLVFHESTVNEVLDLLEESLTGLAKHIKTAEWQRTIHQSLREHMPREHSLCTIDFAENYLCRFQNEVQSAHWSYRQVSVHPCVFHYMCPEPSCFKMITDYVVFLSDDLKHDCHFTKYIVDWCLNYMKMKGKVCMNLFSDGCGAQYKSRFTFQHLTEVQSEHPEVILRRHYFGSSHGKSQCDSCGGTVKNAAARAVSSGSHIIQSSTDLFDFCNEKLSTPVENACFHGEFRRSFVHVKSSEIDRKQEKSSIIKPVKGTQNVHCLVPVKEDVIKHKMLSCTCDVCVLGEQGECSNLQFTSEWIEVNLKSSGMKKGKGKRKQSSLQVGLSSSTSLSRAEFFAAVQEQMSSCATYDQLKKIVDSVLPKFTRHELPNLSHKCVKDVRGVVDSIALNLMSSELRGVYPVVVGADGNCVPRSLSLLVFGTEENHAEVRCRLVAELVSNSYDYLCLDQDLLTFLCEQSDCCTGNLEDTFQGDVLSVCRSSSLMGLWQFLSASNVFGVNIVSVYPSLGPMRYRQFMNRCMEPRGQQSDITFMLQWTATQGHTDDMPSSYWTANHVCPLLPLSEPAIVCLE